MVTITCSNLKYQMANHNMDFSVDALYYSLLSGTVFSDYSETDLRGVSDFTYPFADYELGEGNGYTVGGQLLTGAVVSYVYPYTYIKFNNPTWYSSSITAVGGVIWKPTDYTVVQIHNFNNGQNISCTDGTFLVAFDTNGILRIN